MKVATDHPAEGTLVIRVSGDLRIWGKEEHQEQLINALRNAIPAPTRVIFNMSGIHHIDTAGVGSMARLLIECGKRELDLRVIMPVGFAEQVLKRLHIFDSWPAFPNERAALDSDSSAASA